MADRYDRLSTLISRFDLRVSGAMPGEGNMAVFGDPATGAPVRVEIRTRDGVPAAEAGEVPLAACVNSNGRRDRQGLHPEFFLA